MSSWFESGAICEEITTKKTRKKKKSTRETDQSEKWNDQIIDKMIIEQEILVLLGSNTQEMICKVI